MTIIDNPSFAAGPAVAEAPGKKIAIHLHHAPLVLRVEEMLRDEIGVRVAKQIAEIPLVQGRNEVDAEHWKAWLELNAKGPLITGGIITEEQQETKDGGSGESEGPGSASGPDSEQGEVRDGGVEAAAKT